MLITAGMPDPAGNMQLHSMLSSITPERMQIINETILSRPPNVMEYFNAMPSVYVGFFTLAALLTLIIFIISIMKLWQIFRLVPNEYVQIDLYWLFSTPMVVSIVCLLCLIFQRSAYVLYFFGLAVVVIALSTTVSLMLKLYCGRQGLSDHLNDQDRLIHVNVRPLCCCCSCLPTVRPTPRNIRILSLLVDQTPFVRITLAVILVIIASEVSINVRGATIFLNVIGIVSTLTALTAARIMNTLLAEDLEHTGITVLFYCINIAQTVYTVQRFIFDTIARSGGFNATSPWVDQTIAGFWFNVAMIAWLFIISIVMAVKIQPGKSSFFDANAGRQMDLLVPFNG